MAEIKIIATPDPNVAGLEGDGLAADYDRVGNAAAGKGYTHVKGYQSLADLIAKIAAQIGTNDCLRVLEIYAHGNPTVCNGVTAAGAAAFGAQLKGLKLCDRLDVYLTGCNTGVNNQWDANGAPVAQLVSAAGPKQAVDNVLCYVWGTVGYTTGTFMEDNTNCTDRCTTGQGKKKHKYQPYPPSADGKHQGSQNANGRDHCYRAFKEGSPV